MGLFSSLVGRKKRKGEAGGNVTATLGTPGGNLSVPGNQAMLSSRGIRNEGTDLGLGDRILGRQPGRQGANDVTASENELTREMTEIQEEQKAAGLYRAPLSELRDELVNSKKGGIDSGKGNSQLYNDVLLDLSTIDRGMGQPFTDDPVRNQKLLIEMEKHYKHLVEACAAYTARSPRTGAGKYRKELVTRIRLRASSDLVTLSAVRTDFCAMPASEQKGQNWQDLLRKARAIRISVDDFTKLGKAEGGQASEVYKLDEENTKAMDATGRVKELGDIHFFKPEDEFDMSRKENGTAKSVEKVLQRFPALTEKDRKLIRLWAQQKDPGKENIPKGLSKQGQIVISTMAGLARSMDVTTKEVMPALGLDKQDKVNMSRRNVATSRVANLLGLGHLVAKSETAELYDRATGAVIQGNLMEGAKGEMDGKKFMAEANKSRIVGSVNIHATGGFQRDLVSLQVLDVICGQMDRHAGNFFVSRNAEGELDKVQGIDNDAAFGTNLYAASGKAGEKNDRGIYSMPDENGETSGLLIPYMDKKLAETIRALDPDMLRFALKDLLKDEEIEAAVKRLELTKSAIEKSGGERFLEDDQWNDETAQAMIDQAWDRLGTFNQTELIDERTDPEGNRKQKKELWKARSEANYFGEYMADNSVKHGWDIGKGASPKIAPRKKK